jgi:hypothetical protein
MRSSPVLALPTTALALLVACGGSSVTAPPTPVATPTPGPVRTVVAQGNLTVSAPSSHYTYFKRALISTTAAGTLATTVDWTYPTNTLWMYMAEGECTADQFASDDCPGPACACKFSVESEADTPKPRVLTVPNASPGGRTLIIWNLGPTEEACSYQAVLTTTGTAAAAPAATARGTTMESEMVPKRTPARLLEGR